MQLQEVCSLLAAGKFNIPTAAKKCGVSWEEMKQIFIEYARRTPADPEAYLTDVEPCWPYIT